MIVTMSAGTPKTAASTRPKSDVRLWTFSLSRRSESVMLGSHGDGSDAGAGHDEPLDVELNTLTPIQSRLYFCVMMIIGNSLKQYSSSTGSTKNQPPFRRRQQPPPPRLDELDAPDSLSRLAVSATASGDVIVARSLLPVTSLKRPT